MHTLLSLFRKKQLDADWPIPPPAAWLVHLLCHHITLLTSWPLPSPHIVDKFMQPIPPFHVACTFTLSLFTLHTSYKSLIQLNILRLQRPCNAVNLSYPINLTLRGTLCAPSIMETWRLSFQELASSYQRKQFYCRTKKQRHTKWSGPTCDIFIYIIAGLLRAWSFLSA